MTNAPNLICQSEPPAPKVIMVDNKIRTDVSIFSVGTRSSVTPEKRIPIKKNNMKPPSMFPPRKYLIPNQDNNRSSIKNIKNFNHIRNIPSWI